MNSRSPSRVLEVISRLVGGAAVHAIELSSELGRFGYEARLVHGSAEHKEGTVEDLLSRRGLDSVELNGLQRGHGPGDLLAVLRMRGLIRRSGPALVHTHGAKGGTVGRVGALLAGRRRPRVLVHTFHGHVLTGYFPRLPTVIYRRIERWLARRTTALVVPAAEVKRELVELAVAPADKIRVISQGVDLAPFEPGSGESDPERLRTRELLGIGAEERVVLAVTRLTKVKRMDRFLRVAARIDSHDVRFVVAGAGELASRLAGSQEARALGSRLIWAGQVDRMAPLYRAADLLLATSDHEGAPLSMIEAQACALPVVSTDVGGVGEIVDSGETGVLAEREDEAGLARAVERLLADPGLARSMGAAGRARALKRCSLERLVEDVAALYSELLGETSPVSAEASVGAQREIE